MVAKLKLSMIIKALMPLQEMCAGFALWAMLANSALAADAGTVTRLRGEATAYASGKTRVLSENAAVAVGEKLETGPGARLELRLTDGTQLTLGEKADFTVDELTMAPSGGIALFTRAAGAIKMAAGAISKLPQHRIEIASNAGTIGIRGTEVWGGSLKSIYDVFLIEGEVVVTTPGGTVTLSQPGTGTSVPALGAPPDAPTTWDPALAAAALATVSFTSP